jgi:hypothetical protein
MRLDGESPDVGRAFSRVPAQTVDARGGVRHVLSFRKPEGIVDAITLLAGSFGILMHSTLAQLDRLLYDWLAESDDRRFESAFRRYYDLASSQVVRYLARRSSLPDLDYEQIAVDALLKFFSRAGRDRRQAAGQLAATLPRIQPLDLGVFHVRQVQRWTADVGAFRQASMAFQAPKDDDGGAWKSEIQTLSGRIAPLQRQGWHLLESARIAADGVAVDADADAVSEDDTSEDHSAASPEYFAVRRFALGLRDAVRAGTIKPSACDSHPDLIDFVDRSWSVADALPLLRVPTNGYLFEIAQSLYLDQCKARGRLKRGGSGFAAAGSRADEHLEGNDVRCIHSPRMTVGGPMRTARRLHGKHPSPMSGSIRPGNRSTRTSANGSSHIFVDPWRKPKRPIARQRRGAAPMRNANAWSRLPKKMID